MEMKYNLLDLDIVERIHKIKQFLHISDEI